MRISTGHFICTLGYAVVLAGCVATPKSGTDNDVALTVIELQVDDEQRQKHAPMAIERTWVGRPQPSRSVPMPDDPDASEMIELHIRLRQAKLPSDPLGPARADDYILRIPAWQVSQPEAPRELDGVQQIPVLLVLQQPGMSIAFAGVPLNEAGGGAFFGGRARITLHDSFIEAIQRVEPEPSIRQIILLAMRDLTASQVLAYTRLEQTPDYDQVLALVDHGVRPEWIGQLNAAAYGFDIGDLLRLKLAGVDGEQAVALRKGGLIYGADELIRLHRAKVTAGYALAMKDAGFAGSLDQLITLHRHKVSPGYAAGMGSRGVTDNTQPLIDLHHAGVLITHVDTYKKAGYTLRAAQLLSLNQATVTPADVLAYKEAGYDFSIEDLLNLSRWRVPSSYTLALVSKEFEPLTADQIVDLRLRKVTPDLVKSLRKSKVDRSASSQ